MCKIGELDKHPLIEVVPREEPVPQKIKLPKRRERPRPRPVPDRAPARRT